MKKVLFILLLPILIIMGTYAAKAQQLYLGELARFTSFSCDKEDQLTSVLDAHKEHGRGAAQRLAFALMHTMGTHGEPACMSGTVAVTVIRVTKTYDDLDIAKIVHVIEVMNDNGVIFYSISTIPVIKREIGRNS